MRRYARLLAPASNHRPFAAAVVGRLPIAMAPLSAVLTVRAATGSYAIAGMVAAAIAVGAGIGSPLLGRVVDRAGQSRVVAASALVSGSATIALALAATSGAPPVLMAALAALAGVSFPPLGACMRAAWRDLVSEPADREAAYALDAVAIECIFIAGPVLVGGLLLADIPALPLVVTGLVALVGGVGYALTPVARAWRPEERPVTIRGGALRGRGVGATLTVFAIVSVAFGTLDVSLAATAAEELGNEALVGVLFTAIAGGSLVGGLWYGNRTFTWPQRRRLLVGLAVFAMGLAPLSAASGSLLALLPLLFAAGVGIAPSSIVSHQLLDDLAPSGRRTEAQAWATTANTAGAAAGTALAGVLLEVGGTTLSLRVAPLAVLGALVVAVAVQGRLVPRERPS